MRIALTYHPEERRLKELQVGDNRSLPDTVKIGDFQPNSGWVVAIVSNPADLELVMQDPEGLLSQGLAYEQAHQTRAYLYYALFRFYVIDPKHATTVKEKVALALLREAETVRVVGYDALPDADQDLMAVWDALEATGVTTAPNQFLLIPSGALAKQPMSESNSVAIIDTQQPKYKDWRPVPTQVMANPVLEVSAVATG